MQRKFLTRVWLICLLVLALSLPSPLQADHRTLTEIDSGQTVTLQVGEKLVLSLRNPGSGGYDVLSPVFDDQVLTLLSRRDIPPNRTRPGWFGRIEFTWEARRPGETGVTVNIARPWEKGQPPKQYVHLLVRVGG